MTKIYFTPMLSFVSIKKHDILTASEETIAVSNELFEGTPLAPDRNWDAGY